jgi:hypothetical protein
LSGVPILNATSTHIGWFNVKDDFNAYGDFGVHDDTAAIQNAINAAIQAMVEGRYRCGIIFFPPGSYLISATLLVNPTNGGGLVFMGSGGQASSTPGSQIQGSQIVANFTGTGGARSDVFFVSVPNGGGGVAFRDLSITRNQAAGARAGATFNFDFIVNAWITNVSTSGDYDVFQFGQATGNLNTVNNVYIYGNQFSNIYNSLFQWIGIGGNLRFWDNVISGASTRGNVVGEFAFAASEIGSCDPFYFRNNDVSGLTGGISFAAANPSGSFLSDFWIEGNRFRLTTGATGPCFQAITGSGALVTQGHINHNLMLLGNASGVTPNAVHLDAGGNVNGSKVAGIHLVGNVFGGTAGSPTPGAAIHIANGASDITIIGGRANFQANAIEIVGTVAGSVTDGVTIVGFGANNPQNGYNVTPGPGSKNQVGIAIQPSTNVAVNNTTITGCNLTQCSGFGLLIDNSKGGTITGVTAVGNSFWGYGAGSAKPASVDVNTNINISSNPGYNPVGFDSALAPVIATGIAIPNPYQQAARVFIVSPASTLGVVSITSASGGVHSTGLTPTSTGILIELGVGEQITLSGTLGTPKSSWLWFRE